MATIHSRNTITGTRRRSDARGEAHDAVTATDTPVRTSAARQALAVLRIAFGLTFLWAFFDKLLGLGFATGAITDAETGARTGIDFMAKDQAWLNGGSAGGPRPIPRGFPRTVGLHRPHP